MALTSLGTEPGVVETLISQAVYRPDPLAVMQNVSKTSDNCLLLESAEINSKDNLKSLLMTHAALRIECWGNRVVCQPLTSNGSGLLSLLHSQLSEHHHCKFEAADLIVDVPGQSNDVDEMTRLKAPSVFDVLRTLTQSIEPLREHENAVFLGGVFGYDLLACYEPLPDVAQSENTCPDYLFFVAETLVTFDHQRQEAEVVGSVFSGNQVAENYFAVSQQVEQVKQLIDESEICTDTTAQVDTTVPVTVSKNDEDFKQDVVQLKSNILAGDIFQVVPSRTFTVHCPHPVDAYRKLKLTNPSPYMFYLNTPEFILFGASPESALKYTQSSRQVEVYPIAGTRPRGKHADGSYDHDLDSRLELSLREDEKEKAEHIMLVDLARNDVAKVSEPGTRHVKDLLNVDRYSHVMHLVSRVVGTLRHDLDALHAYQACMNMGTLVGAPKVSAATLIRQVEGIRRGSYGGAVGYLNGSGDMDTCIVIRSAFIRNSLAHIQAGAGVVFDSDPQAEADETRNKAQAVINAVLAAQTGQSS